MRVIFESMSGFHLRHCRLRLDKQGRGESLSSVVVSTVSPLRNCQDSVTKSKYTT